MHPVGVLRVSYPRVPSRPRSRSRRGGCCPSPGWGHGGGRYSQPLRVGSSSSKRRLVETLLQGCRLVSRSGLRGGGPLVSATRARPVLLTVVPLLALRSRARRGLALPDRGGTDRDGLRPAPGAA